MEKNFITQNLYEGAFLLARGCKLVGKESSGGKIDLLFKNNTKTNIESLSFYNGGLVEGKKYSDSYRSLKDYIFTNKNR